jgi:hypothetical protein
MSIKRFHPHQPLQIICRVHESETEIWEDMYAPRLRQQYVGIPYIDFSIVETQLRYPAVRDDKVIGQQIAGNFPELIFQNADEHGYINKGDMLFWFEEPLNGWRQGIARSFFLEEIPTENFSWPKISKIFDGTLRKPLRAFTEGDVIEGKCESIHVEHGLLIDFGCSCAGILPMDESTWTELYAKLPYTKYEELRPDYERLRPGNDSPVFKCKIRRKLSPTVARWPVELDVLEPAWLSDFIIPIHKYEPKALSVKTEFSQVNERELSRYLGRPYRPARSFAYNSDDFAGNRGWLQLRHDYFPGDQTQPFKQDDVFSLKPIQQQHLDRLAHNYTKGKTFEDAEDILSL